MEIKLLSEGTPPPYSLLLLADPAKELVDRYLQEGVYYIGKIEDIVVGVLVLIQIEDNTLEIKNIAIDTNFQGKAYGKKLLGCSSNCRSLKFITAKKVVTS